MNSLLSLLIISSLTIVSLSEYEIIDENSLYGPFKGREKDLDHWDLTGSAYMEEDYIRLTSDEPEERGAIWNNIRHLHNNWEVQVEFRIHGKDDSDSIGDGMAIWYVKDTLQSGAVFGSKNYFTGLGVFIDTFENNPESDEKRFPYISAMVNNGMYYYDNTEDGMMTQVGGCHMEVRNLKFPTRIAITYIDTVLAAYLDVEGKDKWKRCFKTPGVHLPYGYYFGVSASTSKNTDNHDIIYVSTLNMDSEGHELMEIETPMVENIHFPQKYHADFTENDLNIEKKEKQESEENDDDDDDDDNEVEEEEEEVEKIQKEEEENVKTEIPEIHTHSDSAEPQSENLEHSSKTPSTEGIPHDTITEDPKNIPHSSSSHSHEKTTFSWLKIIISIAGVLMIIFVLSTTIKKYKERREERLHKLL